ncbi:tail fiber protein [uncultured Draconibacterium sp.]|uniref:phage tail protein n=1 Tax=uncultured Draconibacterium sp. TaxID=1573823 RepID=UPI0025DCC908|nr:tail fiber protein [uncultured Draconibacterium sp.]
MEPFIGQIMMFGGNFAPRGWALCDGQLLSIAQNTALFSILGTMYGGDGRTTFGLPDLRGRVAIHPGTGPGLSTYRQGQKGGVENVTLSVNQIPSHSHGGTGTIQAASGQPDETSPIGTVPAPLTNGTEGYAETASGAMKADGVTLNIQNTGGSQSHTNVQPYNCVNFIIALQGIFPSRS